METFRILFTTQLRKPKQTYTTTHSNNRYSVKNLERTTVQIHQTKDWNCHGAPHLNSIHSDKDW